MNIWKLKSLSRVWLFDPIDIQVWVSINQIQVSSLSLPQGESSQQEWTGLLLGRASPAGPQGSWGKPNGEWVLFVRLICAQTLLKGSHPSPLWLFSCWVRKRKEKCSQRKLFSQLFRLVGRDKEASSLPSLNLFNSEIISMPKIQHFRVSYSSPYSSY